VLPYVELPSLGPVSPFGIFAVLGVVFATIAGARHVERLGLDLEKARRMFVHCAVGGVLGAHYLDLFLYQPGWHEQPDAVWLFLNPFAGISSYGGLLGGTAGFLVFARRERGKRLRYAEAAALAVVMFLTFGRAGCASVHDHVGVASDSPFAVDFPRIGPHHDLGLYELALFALVLLPASALMLRRPRRAGLYLGVIAIAYAVPRFFLDTLRREVDNPRYLALTPAQWGCLATVAVGLALLIDARGRAAVASYLPATPWRVYLRRGHAPLRDRSRARHPPPSGSGPRARRR
jgi:phosphatidylglycerol:prolipoprotein diacylglycerol transferase